MYIHKVINYSIDGLLFVTGFALTTIQTTLGICTGVVVLITACIRLYREIKKK